MVNIMLIGNNFAIMASTGRGRPVAEVPTGNHFGAWLRNWRSQRGLTGEALAFKLDNKVTQGQISSYETGRKKPEASTAALLAQGLGRDPSEALEALMADAPGVEIEYVPVEDPDRTEYMAFFDNAPNDEARRRLKIIAEQVAAAWQNQQEIVDGNKEKAIK